MYFNSGGACDNNDGACSNGDDNGPVAAVAHHLTGYVCAAMVDAVAALAHPADAVVAVATVLLPGL